MLSYFSGPTKTDESIALKIDNIKKQFRENQTNIETHSQKYKDLIKFTNVLSEGYVSSIKLIVDISSLLESYKELLNEISTGLSKVDDTFKNGLNTTDIRNLKNITEDNIIKLKSTFNAEYDKLATLVKTSTNNQNYIQNLDKVKDLVNNTPSIVGGYRTPKRRQRKAFLNPKP